MGFRSDSHNCSWSYVHTYFRVLGVLHNICIMCGWDSPDLSALTLRCCAPLRLVCTYQASPSCQCYIYNMYLRVYACVYVHNVSYISCGIIAVIMGIIIIEHNYNRQFLSIFKSTIGKNLSIIARLGWGLVGRQQM